MPRTSDQLLKVPLDHIHRHPLNANVMSPERLAKLVRNIARSGRYPPFIVRPHPDLPGHFQLLDGEHRLAAIEELEYETALCFLWPCDDATALTLLATLNRLEGEDVPVRRAALLAELTALLPVDALAELLPEDARAIEETLALLELDSAALLADLSAAAERAAAQAPRLLAFAVLPDDEIIIEKAVARATAALSGPNRRGRALAIICQSYLKEGSA